MIATKETIENIVGNKFFYISYFKKDGSLRKMQSARLNVRKHLKGGINRNPNIGKNQLIVFDCTLSGYRTINLDKIYKIKCGGIELIDNLTQDIFKELNQMRKRGRK